MKTSSPGSRHLLYRAREIRSLVHKAGTVPSGPSPIQAPPGPAPRLGGTRLLVVDFDEAIRKSAHHLLGCQGASVETAHDAKEAIALMRQTAYSAALVDIRLPDLDGYEAFKRLREVQPSVPIILMTGFGWDPTHSIVKARQEGLQTVLYKPFRADRLMEAVEQALRSVTPGRTAAGAPQDCCRPASGGTGPIPTLRHDRLLLHRRLEFPPTDCPLILRQSGRVREPQPIRPARHRPMNDWQRPVELLARSAGRDRASLPISCA